jgi:hypothetical protein
MTFVKALTGAALSGSVATAVVVFVRLIIEPKHADPIGMLLVAILTLDACLVARMMLVIGLLGHRRQGPASRSLLDMVVPREVERDVARDFRRRSAAELERIAASRDLEGWYRKLVQTEIRHREGRVRKLVVAGAAIVAMLAVVGVGMVTPVTAGS